MAAEAWPEHMLHRLDIGACRHSEASRVMAQFVRGESTQPRLSAAGSTNRLAAPWSVFSCRRHQRPPLHLDAEPGAAGDLSRFAGVYAWPDRRVEVTATRGRLLINNERGESGARPLDGRTFLVDPQDPDNPTVTFGAFDVVGRPRVFFEMLWCLPRLTLEYSAIPG
jgi:hypothetical protein